MSKQYQEQKKKWFDDGYKQATSDILEKIEGLDDMFLSKATMNYSEKGDTWTILKQDWNKIVEELKQKIQTPQEKELKEKSDILCIVKPVENNPKKIQGVGK